MVTSLLKLSIDHADEKSVDIRFKKRVARAGAQSGGSHGKHWDSRTSVLEADTAETDGDSALGKEEFIGLVVEFDF
jgi:hypothetical protein